MATKRLKSIKGRVIRITRLDACGAPVVGACSVIVTEGFVSVAWNDEVEEGEEFTQKNAWGDFCINEKDDDRTKWQNVTIVMCEVDPDVLDFIAANATPVIDDAGSGDTIGVTFGPGGGGDAFAVEVWTKQAGVGACAAGSPEWGYFVAPYVRNGRVDGDVTIENAPLNLTLVGQAIEATADWGVGPHGDNPFLATAGFPEGEFSGLVRTTVQPPAATDGCEAVT
jgi:hypothetical protein